MKVDRNGRVHQSTYCRSICLPLTVSIVAVLLAGALRGAQAQTASGRPCGEITSWFGPFDYRIERGENLRIVEQHHFTPRIEMLAKGDRIVGDDLTYTLHVFPNHHRALLAMVKLSQKEKTPQPEKSTYSVECWFDRALRFQPDDTVARALFAQYLAKQGRKNDATKQLEAATFYAKDNGFSHYNIGLLYFEIGEFDLALRQAHKAIALGFVKPELGEMLKRSNKWREPGG